MSEAVAKQGGKSEVWSWLLAFGLLLLAIILQALANENPDLIENYYSRGIYPYIGRSLAYANRLVGFSLAESVTLIFVLLLLTGLVILARALVKRRISWRTFLLSSIKYSVGVAGGGMLLFLMLWGFNYGRQPLAHSLKLEQREMNADELEMICRAMIAEANRAYEEANPQDIKTVTTQSRLPIKWIDLDNLLEESFQREALLGSAARGGFGPVKPVYFSSFMSRLGISGIYAPFTGEPNFNAQQPDCELPYTIAHEKAHQRGFALEDEANFIAYLVCIKSAHPYTRYSGHLMASVHLLRALSRVERERAHTVYATLGSGPRADLKAMRDFWTRYEGKLSQVTESVNNTYLKANRVKSGVENYSEVVALIIGYYFSQHNGSDAANAPVDLPVR